MCTSNNNTVNKTIFLKSNRVVLRPLFESDVPLLTKWINDPEVTQYLSTYYPMTEVQERNWVHTIRNESDIVLALVVEDIHIGSIGIHRINWKDGTATTGTLIGEKEYWGKGYGTEAKMLLLHYAFHTLNLRKICSSVIAYNKRSYNYSKKCGYVEEGCLREHLYRQGRYWDEIQLAVFRVDWEPLWIPFAKEHGIVMRS